MKATLKHDHTGGWDELVVEGRMDANAIEAMEKAIEKATQTAIIINLAAANYINSLAVRTLIRTAKRWGRHASVIVAPQGDVRHVLDITGITRIIMTYETAEAARQELRRHHGHRTS